MPKLQLLDKKWSHLYYDILLQFNITVYIWVCFKMYLTAVMALLLFNVTWSFTNYSNMLKKIYIKIQNNLKMKQCFFL